MTTKLLSSAKKNMYSAEENPQVVEQYLEAELARGGIAGSVPTGGGARCTLESFWGNPQVQPAREVEANSRFVAPRRKERQ